LREAQVDLAHVDRITTIGRLTASLAPEVTQPIAAIITNAQAARHFLNRQPPDRDEVREVLDCIVTEAYRASDVIYRIRGLFKETQPKREAAEINGAIRDVLELTRGEATKNGVSVRTQFAEPSPVLTDVLVTKSGDNFLLRRSSRQAPHKAQQSPEFALNNPQPEDIQAQPLGEINRNLARLVKRLCASIVHTNRRMAVSET
jgi:signal transduction histidine kinase